jgi:D-xylose transport system permease protein
MSEPGPETDTAGVSATSLPAKAGVTISSDAAIAEAFSGDLGSVTLLDSARAYINKVRGGDPGALPALFGLVVLLIVFSNLTKQFLTVGNLANLTGQAGPTILIAMGLTFVLLLGEIDLSAGTAAGVCAMMMGLATAHAGNFESAVKGGSYGAIVLVIALGLVVAVLNRLWPAAAVILLGFVVVLTHLGGHIWIAMFLAIATGTAIGCITGFLVARVGIPSFIVTLAFFLAWQGVIISLAGKAGAIPMGGSYPVNALAHDTVKPTLGWILLIVFVGGYASFTLFRSVRRRSQKLSAEPLSLVLVRIGVLTVLGVFAVYFLNRNRQVNKGAKPIIGMPWVVPLILVLLVLLRSCLPRRGSAGTSTRSAAMPRRPAEQVSTSAACESPRSPSQRVSPASAVSRWRPMTAECHSTSVAATRCSTPSVRPSLAVCRCSVAAAAFATPSSVALSSR